MKKLIIFILLILFGKAGFGQCVCSNCPQPLPDNTNQNFYLTVSDNGQDGIDDCTSMSLEEINISFDHEYIGDLIITIISPCGNSITLMGTVGFYGATDGSVWNISFIDGTPTPDPGFSGTFDNGESWGINGSYTGTYNPSSGAISGLNCADNCGVWIINVYDDQANDFGNFNDFSLDFGDATDTGQLTCDSEPPPPCEDCATTLGPFEYCYNAGESDLVIFEICPPPGESIDAATILTGVYEAGFDNLSVYSGASGSGTSGTLIMVPTFGNLENILLAPADSNDCLIFVSNSDSSISCADGSQLPLSVIACTICSDNGGGGSSTTDIPTLSEWGLILLTLLLMTFGSIQLHANSLSTSIQNVVYLPVFKKATLPFEKSIFMHAVTITSLLIVVGFMICYKIYGAIFTPDIIGVALSSPVFAYLIHLVWMIEKKN